jgi:hypothetical protein
MGLLLISRCAFANLAERCYYSTHSTAALDTLPSLADKDRKQARKRGGQSSANYDPPQKPKWQPLPI